ncbi:MAG: hypothetical protein J6A30_01220 [Ruminococcus sp.]|nr:hypothetical protein [Ruminococcus sp.]
MNNTAALGFTSFRMNLKRGSFLGTLLLISLMFGLFMYRRGTEAEFSETSVRLLSKFMGYYMVLLSADVFAKEFSNGFYKCVHTSGRSESSIIVFKTLSVLYTGLLLFSATAAVHIAVCIRNSVNIDMNLLFRGAVIFLATSLHYSSASALLTSLMNRYKVTVFTMLICYIALPYVYIMYRSITGSEVGAMRFIPFISMDNIIMSYDIDVLALVVTIAVTALFFGIAAFIAEHKDISCDSVEE